MHSFQVYNKETALCYRQLNIGSSRKAWLLARLWLFFSLFSPLLKKEAGITGEWISKICDQKSCLSARSKYLSILWYNWEPPIVKIYLKPIKEMQIVYFF